MSEEKPKYTQRYEHLETGSIILFRQVRPGRYEREDGHEMTIVQLNHYYKWVGPVKKQRRKEQYVANANGFKVRVKS